MASPASAGRHNSGDPHKIENEGREARRIPVTTVQMISTRSSRAKKRKPGEPRSASFRPRTSGGESDVYRSAAFRRSVQDLTGEKARRRQVSKLQAITQTF